MTLKMQSIQNDQVDGLLSKGVKALAINLVDQAAASTVIKKAKQDDIPVVFFNKDPGAKAIGSYDPRLLCWYRPERIWFNPR